MTYLVLTLLLASTLLTLFPVLSGALIVWLIAFAHLSFTQGAQTHATFLFLTAILVAGSMLVEFIAAKHSVLPFRASFAGGFGAVLGGLIGAFFGVVPMLTIGPILGALIGELASGRDTKFIMQIDRYSIVGSYAITFLRLGIALIIVSGWMARELG